MNGTNSKIQDFFGVCKQPVTNHRSGGQGYTLQKNPQERGEGGEGKGDTVSKGEVMNREKGGP